ncbi:hypothetical protein TSOC_000215 [Tetrabaena socialis]|uniref:Uncharacterized protein n=1 Tax=Tetrabaena socialis TaxID=47790 RepID=A0A2J8AK28_9CHLO|nr:hypothetical protein TSOC_000215 [Tetrabaena socialis]|eukprot:PNH12860.1 hypothetical protein TSOC_000215 [Tetrabaena socialis]
MAQGGVNAFTTTVRLASCRAVQPYCGREREEFRLVDIVAAALSLWVASATLRQFQLRALRHLRLQLSHAPRLLKAAAQPSLALPVTHLLRRCCRQLLTSRRGLLLGPQQCHLASWVGQRRPKRPQDSRVAERGHNRGGHQLRQLRRSAAEPLGPLGMRSRRVASPCCRTAYTAGTDPLLAVRLRRGQLSRQRAL